MYSRSYYQGTDESITVPDNYDGTAFAENKEAREPIEVEESVAALSEHLDNSSEDTKDNTALSVFSKIPFLSSLFDTGKRGKPFTLGTEEILLIATAAFLFFSKDGDKECAIFLIILLFVN